MNLTSRSLIAVLVGVVVTFGAVLPTVVETLEKSTEQYSVDNEWHNNTAENTIITLDEIDSGTEVVNGSEVFVAYNVSDGTEYGTLKETTNYTVVSYKDGEFNITSIDDGATEANISADYKWNYNEYVDDSSARTIMDLVPLFIALGTVVMIGRVAGLI